MTMIDAARLRATGPPRPGATGGVTQSGARPAGTGFHVADTASSDAPDAAAPLADTTPVSLSVMLAAEALDRDDTLDRAARRHGQVVLGALGALQRALLQGGDLAGVVEHLGRLIDDMPQATEPQLAALLGSIALRARVEVARLGR